MRKTYLVVGGSSGIGAATSAQLREQGADVWSLTRGKHASPSNELDAQQDERHLIWDAMSDEFPDAIPDTLDGLVYAPGSITLAPLQRLDESTFRNDWEINLLGAVRAIKGSLPALRKGKKPSIVLFSTVAVQTGMPMHSSVAAAKGAVEGLVRALAAEFAPRIRVNAVAPSLTDTPLAQPLLRSESHRQAAEDRHPLQRIASADEVASLACFLLSEQSASISGQILPVDGGMAGLRVFRQGAA